MHNVLHNDGHMQTTGSTTKHSPSVSELRTCSGAVDVSVSELDGVQRAVLSIIILQPPGSKSKLEKQKQSSSGGLDWCTGSSGMHRYAQKSSHAECRPRHV